MDLTLSADSGTNNADTFQRRFSALMSSRKDQTVDGASNPAAESPSKDPPRCRLPIAANSKSSVRSGDRYKTELCRQFNEGGSCRYGDKCQFAHGPEDRRSVARHPKYKTSLCRTFHSTGFCPYGARCHFIHGEIGTTDSGSAAVMWHRGTLDSLVVTAGQLMHGNHSSIIIHRLIETMINNNQSVTDSSYSTQKKTTTTSISPSVDIIWSSAHIRQSSASMESTSASPSLSCSDSPNPSPTSMLPDEDIWASLASIIGVGL